MGASYSSSSSRVVARTCNNAVVRKGDDDDDTLVVSAEDSYLFTGENAQWMRQGCQLQSEYNSAAAR